VDRQKVRKYAINPPPDVKVHHKSGCYCGRTDAHTHTQAAHQRQVDKADPYRSGGNG
jgi:hypothetical protein